MTSASTTPFMRAFLLIAIPVFLLSCTSGKPAATTVQKTPVAESRVGPAAGYTLEITPPEPSRNSVLVLTPKGFYLSEATITWLVNGMVVTGASTGQLQATEAAKGDTVQAKAVLRGIEILSNSVRIRNTPPAVSQVKFVPDVFRPGDRLGVESAGTDADGDAVTLLYAWTLNGEPAGDGKSINNPVKRGDTVAVKITPFDGEEYGSPVVLRREIRNTPPVIVEHKECSFDGSVYTYQVRASDPDGDTLTYSLESPPAGMTIDRSTGLLKWVVPQEFKGKKNATVVVSDGNGGTATCSVEIAIQ
jgi:hypothetical protein